MITDRLVVVLQNYNCPVPNISTLAILIHQGKSSQNSHLGSPNRISRNSLDRRFSLHSYNLHYKALNFLEFSGIFLERVFGVPNSRFRGKMKLICWAAVNYNENYRYRSGPPGNELKLQIQTPSLLKGEGAHQNDRSNCPGNELELQTQIWTNSSIL